MYHRTKHYLSSGDSNKNGHAEEKEKGSTNGQEWLWEVFYALYYLQQLCRKGRSTLGSYDRCGTQPCQIHGQLDTQSVGLWRVPNLISKTSPDDI